MKYILIFLIGFMVGASATGSVLYSKIQRLQTEAGTTANQMLDQGIQALHQGQAVIHEGTGAISGAVHGAIHK